MSSLRGRLKRSRAVACFAIAATALGVNAAGAMAAPFVKIVTQGPIPTEGVPKNTTYFSTIQAAVNSTKKGDWVLIEPGIYKEEVKVTKANIHIRGMNRNSVILDGAGLEGGVNGIEVLKSNNVWIENMTARNFEEGKNGGGNDFWWSGGNDPGKVTAHGWWGKYLTAYDTGLGGGYGIFAQYTKEGSWDNIYASGFNDSGIYIGACQQCKARVNKATIENNAVGYSGSNSGGELVIENSRFAHNSDGIVPNGENPGDGPPPNNGACNRRNGGKPNPTPSFTSTKIERCEVFKYNTVTENDNLTVPANGSTIKSPYGAGIELPGDYAELIEHNEITRNPTDGILAFEYPNPFPPTEKTIYFELRGQQDRQQHVQGKRWSRRSLRRGYIHARRLVRARKVAVDHELHRHRGGSELVRRRHLPVAGTAGNDLGLPERNHSEPEPRGGRDRMAAVPAGCFRSTKDARTAGRTSGSGNDAETVHERSCEPAVPERRSRTVLAQEEQEEGAQGLAACGSGSDGRRRPSGGGVAA